jgi:hypothetical protein
MRDGMSGQVIESADIEALASILENEKKSHGRTRSLCLALFVFCFFMLVVAICTLTFLLVTARLEGDLAQNSLTFLQLLTPLSAAVIGFFTSWWTAQNCINSIDRTLFAARSGRQRLFVSFLEQLQCADKKKRRAILDVVGALVS